MIEASRRSVCVVIHGPSAAGKSTLAVFATAWSRLVARHPALAARL
ncbi:hypothetical protein [Nonomuraea sp. NPDC050783]